MNALHRVIIIRILGGLALLLGLTLLAPPARAACSSIGCVSAGPRLASVNSTQGALLNLLLGSLTNSTLSVSVLDWNTLASGDVSLLRTLSALQATFNTSTPAETLTTNITLLQLLTAASTGATAEGKTQLAASIDSLKLPLNGLSTPFQLGQLLQSNGVLGTTRINALELITGAIQLYNARNVVATPNAITVSGSSLGLGALLNNISLQATVVEPPVIVCGGVGSTFHSAAIRVKLDINLISVALDVSGLSAILLGSTLSANVAHLDLYVEVARTDGVITAINAISNAVTVQATPGVAALYLGLIDDSLFFNRSRAVNAASDLTWSTIGSLKVGAVSIDILAKAAAIGSASGASSVTLTGSSPGATVYAGGAFATTLVSTLIGNLQLSLGPGLLSTVVDAVLTVLKPVLQTTLTSTVGSLVTGVVNPLLSLLGIRLGETDINMQGTALACAVSGTVYEDKNHSAALDSGETGTGVTLYAKLIPATQPTGPALAVVAVDPTSGAFSFSSVAAAGYVVVINSTLPANDLTPAVPTGWIGTEAPTLSRSFTLGLADVPNQRFGLYHGGRFSGMVFKDNGVGTGGLANNGLRDGTEATLPGITLAVMDAGGTVLERATTGDTGAYTLWVPSTATGPFKVAHATQDAAWVVVSGQPGTTGGTFSLADGSISFALSAGSSQTGVNFGDVPANVLQPDGQQNILAGSTAVYAHTFTAGTGGVVSFATSAVASNWTAVVYRDLDCNGKADASDPVLTGTVTMVADQKLCVLVKITAPAGVTDGTQQPVTLTAHYAYANSTLTKDQQRSDVTTVGTATDAGLKLVKVVDKTSATTGDLITYTITFSNNSSDAIVQLKIQDATPAYTVFQSAACGTMPLPSLTCTISTQPAVGASGRVEWTIGGSLSSGLAGTVTLVVKLQ